MQAIADQLQGGDMALDYDQILAKRPASEDAIFAWYVPFIFISIPDCCWSVGPGIWEFMRSIKSAKQYFGNLALW